MANARLHILPDFEVFLLASCRQYVANWLVAAQTKGSARDPWVAC